MADTSRKPWHAPPLRVFERVLPFPAVEDSGPIRFKIPKPSLKQVALSIAFSLNAALILGALFGGKAVQPFPGWILPFFLCTGSVIAWQWLNSTELVEYNPFGAWLPNEFEDNRLQLHRPACMNAPLPEVVRIEFRSESLLVELVLGSMAVASIEARWEDVVNIVTTTIREKTYLGFSVGMCVVSPTDATRDVNHLMRQSKRDYGSHLVIDVSPFAQNSVEMAAIALPYQEHAWVYINQC